VSINIKKEKRRSRHRSNGQEGAPKSDLNMLTIFPMQMLI